MWYNPSVVRAGRPACARAISSVGQSYRLITGWSGVRVPGGAPEKPHSSVEKRAVWLFFFVSDGELDYFLTTFHGVLRFAGKILVEFIGNME